MLSSDNAPGSTHLSIFVFIPFFFSLVLELFRCFKLSESANIGSLADFSELVGTLFVGKLQRLVAFSSDVTDC